MKDNEINKLESELHQEFQLERVILFSDAVFAIAITLMVIELKIPDISKNESSTEFWSSLGPLLRNFLALMVSFFFIGMYWYRHLRLCGLLIDYNRTFIILNLFFLFFIVLFPFSVSSMMALSHEHMVFGMLVYFINIYLTVVTHFILYKYLLGKTGTLCKPISVPEKKILIEESLIPIVIMTLLFGAFLVSIFVMQNHPEFTGLVFLPVALIAFMLRRRIKVRHKKMRDEIFSNPA